MKKIKQQQLAPTGQIQITSPPHAPVTPKSKGPENLQNFQTFTYSSKRQVSRESLDTECTSDPPDHSDKHSLKSIDEIIEFQDKQLSESHSPTMDFHPLATEKHHGERAMELLKEAEDKLKGHFRQTMKIDKYLRIISAIIKTRRAYNPKSQLNPLYKELILARRVIRWQSKYDTIISLLGGDDGVGMKLFKLMQLSGDLVDLSGYWLKICNRGTDNRAEIIQRLERTESNFYFAECLIWFFVYTYRYTTLRKEKSESSFQEEQRKRKMRQNLLKAVKYVMDILTSYNNSSLKRVCGEINHKVAGYLTVFSSAIGIYLLWL